MLHCYICDKKYKNAEWYNMHLDRRTHQKRYINLLQLHNRNIVKNNQKWQQYWDSNQPKQIKKINTNNINANEHVQDK